MHNLGKAGAIIEVADGYARNYLVPRGFAFEYSGEQAKKALRETEKASQQAAMTSAEAGKLIISLSSKIFEIVAKANEKDSLYSAVPLQAVADLIRRRTGLSVHESELRPASPLKRLGKFELEFRRGEARANFSLIVKAP